MSDWMDKAEQELCDQLNSGQITQQEFDRYMRDLMEEIRQGADEAAEEARANYYY